jgi:hypothetical protein
MRLPTVGYHGPRPRILHDQDLDTLYVVGESITIHLTDWPYHHRQREAPPKQRANRTEAPAIRNRATNTAGQAQQA